MFLTILSSRGFGVGFSTGLGGPFDANNNGYFASWAALILSVIYLAYAWALLGRSNYYLTHFHHALLLLLFASLVVMAVSANFCELWKAEFYHRDKDAEICPHLPAFSRQHGRRGVQEASGVGCGRRRHFHVSLPAADGPQPLCLQRCTGSVGDRGAVEDNLRTHIFLFWD